MGVRFVRYDLIMAVTLKDVAQRAGVSVPTASRVLSGSTYPVVEDLRDRVRAAALELDYVPNAQAQGLLRGNTGTIGVLVGDVNDPFYAEIVNGIHDLASSRNLLVTICHTGRDPERELGYFRMLQSHRARSVILAGSGVREEDHCAGMAARVTSFCAAGGRVVAIGTPVVDVDRVVVDDREGGRLIGRHLAELGHREVGLIAGPETLIAGEERRLGMQEELEAAGARLSVRHVEPRRDEGHRAAGELLESRPGLTALMGTEDQLAIGALTRVRELGLDVPGDVSITGFDGIDATADLAPALTTVRLPLREMGRTALELALGAAEPVIAGGPGPESAAGADRAPADRAAVVRRFDVELVVRGSTGPARS